MTGTPLMWSLFAAFVFVALLIDFFALRKQGAHHVTIKEAAIWSMVWVAVSFVFVGWMWWYLGGTNSDPALQAVANDKSLEFITGYLVEKALAVDNIFVFVLVFGYFGIPAQYQHRVLFYGIVGALLFRAIFIALGSVLMQYWIVVTIFGLFLIATGLKMMRTPDQHVDPGRNLLIRLFRRWMPVTPELHGQQFFVRLQGRLHATPLFVALLFLEMSDIIFAVDSVPAIFAISREPLIVFTSNVFAILGLRAMYFLLADAVGRFHLLKYALAAILIFVGLKMVWLNDLFGGKFPIEW
ncbi:MAG TPA: TerC/Alx family metal homeostasis membrane protein, partial [Steroidobacteraceae bacterium]|nr:TerC/Alx family metal homeostasis membrane protein [Steroidobacteraceae bacterium]